MDNSLLKKSYNPDVLSCLANLSNDEVFTPPQVASKMLDMLPKELWSNPDAKFLDPACKSGVFLREIAKRLLEGLAEKIPDLQERIDHIFHNQLYGIAITELTSLLSRRSVYCSKYPNCKYSVSHFDTQTGNIFYTKTKHTWEGDKCIYCGASKKELDRGDEFETHAYQFIHNAIPEEIKKMKFDVIISNPPYQLGDGGAQASASPIYQYFIQKAIKLNPMYLCMIIPSRWFTGGKGLDDFRAEMLHDSRIRTIVDIPNPNDAFPGIPLKGGVCYFLWNRDSKGKCFVKTFKGNSIISSCERDLLEKGCDVFIRYNEAISILRKVQKHNEKTFDQIVSGRKPFGLDTEFVGNETGAENSIKIYGSKKISYINKDKIPKGLELINKYKVMISYAYGAGDDYPHQIINKPFIADKGSGCSETYLVIGPSDNKKITEDVISYICTRFFRFLVMLKKNTQHATRGVYQFVPLQDFTSNSDIDWTKSVDEIDAQLYAKYNLKDNEIAFIESMIKPMDNGGGASDAD